MAVTQLNCLSAYEHQQCQACASLHEVFLLFILQWITAFHQNAKKCSLGQMRSLLIFLFFQFAFSRSHKEVCFMACAAKSNQ